MPSVHDLGYISRRLIDVLCAPIRDAASSSFVCSSQSLQFPPSLDRRNYLGSRRPVLFRGSAMARSASEWLRTGARLSAHGRSNPTSSIDATWRRNHRSVLLTNGNARFQRGPLRHRVHHDAASLYRCSAPVAPLPTGRGLRDVRRFFLSRVRFHPSESSSRPLKNRSEPAIHGLV